MHDDEDFEFRIMIFLGIMESLSSLLYYASGDAKPPEQGMVLGSGGSVDKLGINTWIQTYARVKLRSSVGSNLFAYEWLCKSPGCEWHLRIRRPRPDDPDNISSAEWYDYNKIEHCISNYTSLYDYYLIGMYNLLMMFT